MTDRDRLKALIKTNSFQYNKEPIFKLVSGAMSNFYFNLKKTTLTAQGIHLVGKVVFDFIQSQNLTPKAIGGLTMGADPIAVAVAGHSYMQGHPIDAFVVRKEPKAHGLGLQIEGNIKAGDNVIVIDDVITTGGSTIKAIEAVLKNDLTIDAVIVIVDRQEQNGRQKIASYGYPVYSIFTASEFI